MLTSLISSSSLSKVARIIVSVLNPSESRPSDSLRVSDSSIPMISAVQLSSFRPTTPLPTSERLRSVAADEAETPSSNGLEGLKRQVATAARPTVSTMGAPVEHVLIKKTYSSLDVLGMAYKDE